jgi:hypothetical protein
MIWGPEGLQKIRKALILEKGQPNFYAYKLYVAESEKKTNIYG